MSALYLGIDPGSSCSAYSLWDSERELVLDCGIATNDALVMLLNRWAQNGHTEANNVGEDFGVAIESPAVLGKKGVHAELLETAHQAGVFWGICNAYGLSVHRITYHTVRTHITRNSNANEAEVKQSLISRFAPECKPRRNVGAFALVPTGKVIPTGKTERADEVSSGHVWSATGVAVVQADLARKAAA